MRQSICDAISKKENVVLIEIGAKKKEKKTVISELC